MRSRMAKKDADAWLPRCSQAFLGIVKDMKGHAIARTCRSRLGYVRHERLRRDGGHDAERNPKG